MERYFGSSLEMSIKRSRFFCKNKVEHGRENLSGVYIFASASAFIFDYGIVEDLVRNQQSRGLN